MNDMFVTFLGTGLWAVIKAVLILLLAFLVAGIVKSLVVKLLTKTKLSVLPGKTVSPCLAEQIGQRCRCDAVLFLWPYIVVALLLRLLRLLLCDHQIRPKRLQHMLKRAN